MKEVETIINLETDYTVEIEINHIEAEEITIYQIIEVDQEKTIDDITTDKMIDETIIDKIIEKTIIKTIIDQFMKETIIENRDIKIEVKVERILEIIIETI